MNFSIYASWKPSIPLVFHSPHIRFVVTKTAILAMDFKRIDVRATFLHLLRRKLTPQAGNVALRSFVDSRACAGLLLHALIVA